MIPLQNIWQQCFIQWRESIKMSVPAGLYLFQNNILFIAITNLPAAVYQVTYQLKILTTAAFHVAMLGRPLSREQIQSLVLLVVGVSLVQLANLGDSSKSHNVTDGEEGERSQNTLVGLGAILTACCSSGFAGVYFEKVLKSTRTTLWMRNMQLAFFSLFLCPPSLSK